MVKKKLYLWSNAIAFIIAISTFGYVYGLPGLLLGLVMQVCLGLLVLVSFVPVIGIFIFGWLAVSSVIPFLLSVFGVAWDWPVTLLLVIDMVVGLGAAAQMMIRIFTNWHRV